MELKVFSDRAEASDAAAQFIAANVRSILTNASEVLVAVPGGSTPRACLTLLGQQDLPWPHIAVTLTVSGMFHGTIRTVISAYSVTRCLQGKP